MNWMNQLVGLSFAKIKTMPCINVRPNKKFRARVRFKGKIIGDKTTDDFFEACCFVKSLKNKINLKVKER